MSDLESIYRAADNHLHGLQSVYLAGLQDAEKASAAPTAAVESVVLETPVEIPTETTV